MNNDINVVFFDLFFTLVTPRYSDLRNENDVLRIIKTHWEKYAEHKEFADYYIEDFKEIKNILINHY